MSSNRDGQTGAGFTQSFGLVMVIIAGLVLAILLIALFAWQPWGAEVTPELDGSTDGGSQEATPHGQQGGTPAPQSYELIGGQREVISASPSGPSPGPFRV